MQEFLILFIFLFVIDLRVVNLTEKVQEEEEEEVAASSTMILNTGLKWVFKPQELTLIGTLLKPAK